MTDLTLLLDAPAGEIVVEARVTGCFSGSDATVALAWHDGGGTLRIGAATEPIELRRDEARDLAMRALRAASRCEVGSGGRQTTRHEAVIRWRTEPGGPLPHEGQRTFDTFDLPLEQLAALLEGRPDLAARVPPDVHSAALSLHALVREIVVAHHRSG